jgi:hypothetical protein
VLARTTFHSGYSPLGIVSNSRVAEVAGIGIVGKRPGASRIEALAHHHEPGLEIAAYERAILEEIRAHWRHSRRAGGWRRSGAGCA